MFLLVSASTELMGVRTQGGPVLRLRARGGEQLNTGADSGIAFVDVNYSRFQDAQVHQVFVPSREDCVDPLACSLESSFWPCISADDCK